MRRAEPDVVRKHRRAVDIVVAVDRVGSPDHRDLDRHVGRHRRVVISLRQREPVGHARVFVLARPGAAAVEDRAEIIAPHIVGSDRPDVGLGHLPDLLLERHSGDDPPDQRFVRGGITGRRVLCLRVGQRDAAGEAPDECASAGDRSSAPASRTQTNARSVSRVNWSLPALGAGIIICITSDVFLLPIAECHLQHTSRWPIAGTGEAMTGIARNPDFVACLALARILDDLTSAPSSMTIQQLEPFPVCDCRLRRCPGFTVIIETVQLSLKAYWLKAPQGRSTNGTGELLFWDRLGDEGHEDLLIILGWPPSIDDREAEIDRVKYRSHDPHGLDKRRCS